MKKQVMATSVCFLKRMVFLMPGMVGWNSSGSVE